MSISNSANNVFCIGPGLKLVDQDFIVVSVNQDRTTKIDLRTVSALTLSISAPYVKADYDFSMFARPPLYSLVSSVKLLARGSFGEEILFYKPLASIQGSKDQIHSISDAFNSLHGTSVELAQKVYRNIEKVWTNVRDHSDIDQTGMEDVTVQSLNDLNAQTLRFSVPFRDTRGWLERKIAPYVPK